MSNPSLKKNRDVAALALAAQTLRIANYVANPALDADGGPLPLPLRFRIAKRTAEKRLAEADAAYTARYKRVTVGA